MNWSGILGTLKDILYFLLFKIKQTDVTLASLIVFTVVVALFAVLSRIIGATFSSAHQGAIPQAAA